jgi:hypothetical protein
MSDKNINFDREDQEQIAQSAQETWSSLEFALGLNNLPKIDRLFNANETQQAGIEQRVAQSIRDVLFDTRGTVDANLQTQIQTELAAERTQSTPSTPEGGTESYLEQRSVSVAEAYIRVINRVIERRDVKRIIDELPASIRPIDGSRNWTATNVSINGTPCDIVIDLSNPIWRSGSQQEIEARLNGRTLAQAGITQSANIVPINHPLDATDITAIFGSSTVIIDPRLPIRQVVIEGRPTAAERATVDIPGLLRAWPVAANLNSAAIKALPQGLLTRHIRAVNIATGIDVPFINIADQEACIDDAFTQLSRNPGSAFASAASKLSDAVTGRQVVDDLLEGTADNRELLLAISAIQRDPTAAGALANNNSQQLLNTRNRLTNESNLRTSLDALKGMNKPTRSVALIQTEIDAINSGTIVLPAKSIITRVQQLETEKKEVQKVVSEMQQVIAIISRVESLNAVLIGAAGSGLPLEAYSTAPNLETHIVATANFDPAQIAALIETTFNSTTSTSGDKGQILEAADHYGQALTENAEAVRKAGEEKELNGSEKAWAIVRRELENRGMRQDQLEKTLQYMKNQLDHTPESARDVEELTNSVYDYVGEAENGTWFKGRWRGKGTDGEPTPAAQWQEDKSHRRLWTLGLLKHKPSLDKYKKSLFTEQNIGITLAQADTAMSRSVPMPRLIDAYFRVKYLSELPDGDPRRLPDDSRETVELLRKLHKAILERAQFSFHNATAATEAEMEQLGIKKDMTKLERLQAAQSFLLNEKETYFAENKATMDKIIDRAYRPIRLRLERHNKWKEAWKGNGPWYNPVGWPVNGAKFAGGQAKALATGNGSVYNPVTYPARAVKGTTRGLISFLKMEV